ncbi:hypothetical protein [Desulfovermiculus halophilus]|uniref:hypothetical protein n=1 Tax=Desulfovermiculus halophilus TaxID=339722 RepID=UPI000482FDAA|nr:hypothetical protein [Desulfovermiculus halophilus]
MLDEDRRGYLRLYPRLRQAERRIDRLNKRLDRTENEEQIETLEKEKAGVMKDFLREYYAQEEGRTEEAQEPAGPEDPFADLQ